MARPTGAARNGAREDDADLGPAWLARQGERPLRTLAVIWATVELERALRDAGSPPVHRQPVVDRLLGARVLLVKAADSGGPVALAEPSTEGRLAATLVRHGEGPAGRYVLAPASIETVRHRAAAAGVAVTRSGSGPFGPSVLVLGGPVGGPHLIVVGSDPARGDQPAVPSPS
jgi:hypothetical protein